MEESERATLSAASKEISRQFKTLINVDEVETLKNLQLLILKKRITLFWRLGRLQDSNAVLSHFNDYSEQCFHEIAADFTRNTRLLKSMKSDLDHIFQKLRSMKAKIQKCHPHAFQDASASFVMDERPDLEIPLPSEIPECDAAVEMSTAEETDEHEDEL